MIDDTAWIQQETERLLNGRVKVCICGCGEPLVANRTPRRDGRTRPAARFIRGHNRRSIGLGMTHTAEYAAYYSAKDRCRNPHNTRWDDYGGRGIEFRFESFAQFFVNLGTRPEGMSLDRRDVNGNYEPGNVRWATAVEQANNKRCQLDFETVPY